MEKMIVVCPKCGANFDLTQAVRDDLVRAVKEEALEEIQKTHLMEIEDLR
jgi:hypothetical protein